jgi:hypothetical protein
MGSSKNLTKLLVWEKWVYIMHLHNIEYSHQISGSQEKILYGFIHEEK